MRILGHLLLCASVLALLSAIWVAEYRWQSAASAVVLLLVGAAVLGQIDKTTTRKDS
ncbi:hypothetical protein [Kocuria sp. CCUG 69068]|uniref:hypothetical protein n=1 Tax=Kocuria sp. CCUG 69068 TaxID=2043138 RepID=UPI001E382212